MRTFSPRLNNTWVIALLLMALSIVAASPLFTDGWFVTHDGIDPIDRIIALAEEIRHGDFYPRWLSVSYNGKGSPFSNFYSPAFHLTAAWLYVAGLPLIASIKLLAILLFFVGAWGMYLWTSRHYATPGAAISAIVYLFLPYHFVDVYVRGAFAEFTALAVLPYLFLSIDMTMDNFRGVRGIWLLALSSSLLLLSHNLSTLMIVPFALLYTIVFHCISLKKNMMVAIGVLLGAGLSAFYWLPVITERKYLRNFSESLSEGYFDYRIHFVSPEQWFSRFWGFGGSNAGSSDGMSFQIGILLLVLLSVMLVSLFFSDKRQRQFPLITFSLGTIALILTTDSSAPFFQLFPAFAYLQFPWRFLGPATFFLAASCGLLGDLTNTRWRSMTLVIAISLFAIYLSSDHRVIFETIQKDFDIFAPHSVAEQCVGPLCVGHEYLPLWADPGLIETTIEMKPYSSTGVVSGFEVQGDAMSFSFEGKAHKNTIVIPRFYFPGWQAMINRQPISVEPSGEGFLSLSLPKGLHVVTINFASTFARKVGWAITCGTLLVFITFLWYKIMRHPN